MIGWIEKNWIRNNTTLLSFSEKLRVFHEKHFYEITMQQKPFHYKNYEKCIVEKEVSAGLVD